MKQALINHVCEDCALRKEIVIEKVDQDDVDVYELILTGINTAQMANDPSMVPDGVSEEKMKAYFEAAIGKEAHYRKLEMEWWRNMMKKYQISDKTKMDTVQGNFYHCLDKEGNEQIDFISSEKKLKEAANITPFEKP
jgi:hypothetical protein